MLLLSERAITVHAHARPSDTKRSRRSARLAWVNLWVTQESHRTNRRIRREFMGEARVLPWPLQKRCKATHIYSEDLNAGQTIAGAKVVNRHREWAGNFPTM